jgi:hypothetical protein
MAGCSEKVSSTDVPKFENPDDRPPVSGYLQLVRAWWAGIGKQEGCLKCEKTVYHFVLKIA